MEEMVKGIMEALTRVGFPESLVWPLQVHLCFAPPRFPVVHEQYRGEDRLHYQIWMVRDAITGVYAPAYYDACLVRPLALDTELECSGQLLALNQQMRLINWAGMLDKGANATVGDFADLRLIAEIVQSLHELELAEEGALYADLLRLRYWARTPFDAYARQGVASRNAFEVSQRFHFFSDGQGITLDEAYRFLLHRLHEKRLQGLQRVGKELAVPKVRKGGKS